MSKSILVRDVPDDVLQILLKAQYEEKQQRSLKQYSLSLVIFKMARDFKKKSK
jgi:hypothetical protein